MPLFKGKASKAKPKKAIDYVTNPQKAVIVTSQSLDDNRSYAKQFKETCDIYGKGKGVGERKYYHFKLSCNPDDYPTPQQSHELAEKLAQQLFPDHECIIATHDDTDTLHSHIIVNAVSFETGRKLHLNDKAYRDCKDLANTLGAEMGLSTMDWRTKTKEKRERSKTGEVITNEAKYLSSAERNMAKNKELSTASWKEALRSAIDEAKAHTTNRSEFQNYLQEHFSVTMPRNTAKTVSFIHPAVGETYAIRGNKLGADYTAHAIDEMLQQNKNYNDRRVLDEGLFSTESYTATTSIPTPQPHDWAIPSERNVQERSRKRITPRSISDISAELRSLDTAVAKVAGVIPEQSVEVCAEHGAGRGHNHRENDIEVERFIGDSKREQRVLHDTVAQHREFDEQKPSEISRPVEPTPQPEPVVQQKPRRSYSGSSL